MPQHPSTIHVELYTQMPRVDNNQSFPRVSIGLIPYGYYRELEDYIATCYM